MSAGWQTSEAAPAFNLQPSSGVVEGAAGGTVCSGYSITNDSASQFLVTTAIDAGTFLQASPLAILDFPAIAPGATAIERFVADVSGLYDLTWSAQAQEGANNTVLFVLSDDYYFADPLAGGTFVSTAADVAVAYTANVGLSVAPVSKPTNRLKLHQLRHSARNASVLLT